MIRKIEERLIFDNDFAKIFNDSVMFPNGLVGTHLRVMPSSRSGVVVIPVMLDGTISMIENYRYAIGGIVTEFPQGGVEIDEPLSVAAQRELLEETGLTCQKLTYAGRIFSAPSILAGESNIFIAWGCSPSLDVVKGDKFEAITSIKSHPLNKVSEIIINDEYIVDASTTGAYHYLSSYLPESLKSRLEPYAFLMGAYCNMRGINASGNPFRNDLSLHKEFNDWEAGWRYGEKNKI